ncbi:MAG: putative orfan [Satyrvirus sp.]|uniref:Putative orfan n=1 Tax=Satyrvirus sp. TaxID=2487771 RepID=A0A3G5AGC4_9VIRU|nr:MAG: putative orfan [Satyrvirus sp.]
MEIDNLQYNIIENSSYRLSAKNKYNNKSPNYNNISECSDPSCVYYRPNTILREKYENKIIDTIGDKTNIKILFYGSFMLYQELKILAALKNKISEIHLTDYAYKNFHENEYCSAFSQFIEYIAEQKLTTKVYLHCKPDELKNSSLFKRRFDIICGIDIDYEPNSIDNQLTMREIANNTLKIDGVMYISQNNIDQVGLFQYEIGSAGKIIITKTEDYVKSEYYNIYVIQNILFNLYNLINFLISLLLISVIILKKWLIIPIIMGLYSFISIMYYYLNIYSTNNYERNIKRFDEIYKNIKQLN